MEVKKLPRLCFITALAGLTLFGVALLGLNLLVQSAGVQQRLVESIEEAIGAPVEIRQTSASPWNGITLKGIRVASPGRPKESLLTAESFSARFSIPALFQKRVVVKQIKIERPAVIWRQAEDGRWHLPGEEIPENESAPVAEAPSAMPVHETGTKGTATTGSAAIQEPGNASARETSPEPKVEHEPKPSPSPDQFEVEIKRVRLKGGEMVMLDRDGEKVCGLKGVDFFMKVESPEMAVGDAAVERISVRDRLRISEARTEFSYTPNHLELHELTAGVGGGKLRVNARVQPQVAETPFDLETAVENASLDALVSDAGWQKDIFEGALHAQLKLSGNLGSPDSHVGVGAVQLVNCGLRDIPVLKTLGDMLKIEELQHLTFSKSEVNYRIEASHFEIDPLLLKSANLTLVAMGQISYDGAVKMHAKLYASEDLSEQLPKEIQASFQPAEDMAGYRFVAFEVTGTVDKLKTNLDEKLIPKKYRSFYDGIKNLRDFF